MMNPESIRLRARGCLLGQLAGDSLGSLVEFMDADSIRRQYPKGIRDLVDGGTWKTLAGQPTDDSEMALALARTLVAAGRCETDLVRQAYVDWMHSGPFDIGGTTSAGLRGVPNPESQANGALMRSSPLGIFCAGSVIGAGAAGPGAAGAGAAASGLAKATVGSDDTAGSGVSAGLEFASDLAAVDAAITHPNPVCIQANRLFVMAIAMAVAAGPSPRELYREIVEWAAKMQVAPTLMRVVKMAADARPADYLKSQGWVLIALQNALWQLLHAQSLEDGIVDTVMQGGDTDTNACICGALLGAVHGQEAVPERWTVVLQACRPEAGRPGVRRPRPDVYWPCDVLELADALLDAGEQASNT